MEPLNKVTINKIIFFNKVTINKVISFNEIINKVIFNKEKTYAIINK